MGRPEGRASRPGADDEYDVRPQAPPTRNMATMSAGNLTAVSTDTDGLRRTGKYGEQDSTKANIAPVHSLTPSRDVISSDFDVSEKQFDSTAATAPGLVPDSDDVEAQKDQKDNGQVAAAAAAAGITVTEPTVSVQPSVGETSELTTDDVVHAKDGGSKKTSWKCWVRLAVLLVMVAAVAAGTAVAIDKKSKGKPPPPAPASPPPPPPGPKCLFCENGFIPTQNQDDNVLGEGDTTCAQFFESQTALDENDPNCVYGQAIAWASCGCPTLPPPEQNPSCTICPDGSTPSGLNCAEIDIFISHVDGILAECDQLRQVVSTELSCTCA